MSFRLLPTEITICLSYCNDIVVLLRRVSKRPTSLPPGSGALVCQIILFGYRFIVVKYFIPVKLFSQIYLTDRPEKASRAKEGSSPQWVSSTCSRSSHRRILYRSLLSVLKSNPFFWRTSRHTRTSPTSSTRLEIASSISRGVGFSPRLIRATFKAALPSSAHSSANYSSRASVDNTSCTGFIGNTSLCFYL